MRVVLNHDEAQLFHHFVTHLGRWLDCTNAARLFTLIVSEKAGECPVLVNAILCFSARHQGKDDQGEKAYERALTLLIDRLNETPAQYDEMLLSAVLLLHFADQLNCMSQALTLDTLTDQPQHELLISCATSTTSKAHRASCAPQCQHLSSTPQQLRSVTQRSGFTCVNHCTTLLSAKSRWISISLCSSCRSQTYS